MPKKSCSSCINFTKCTFSNGLKSGICDVLDLKIKSDNSARFCSKFKSKKYRRLK